MTAVDYDRCKSVGQSYGKNLVRCEQSTDHSGLHTHMGSFWGTPAEVDKANEWEVCGKVWDGHVCYKPQHHPFWREHECWCGRQVVQDLAPIKE